MILSTCSSLFEIAHLDSWYPFVNQTKRIEYVQFLTLVFVEHGGNKHVFEHVYVGVHWRVRSLSGDYDH